MESDAYLGSDRHENDKVALLDGRLRYQNLIFQNFARMDKLLAFDSHILRLGLLTYLFLDLQHLSPTASSPIPPRVPYRLVRRYVKGKLRLLQRFYCNAHVGKVGVLMIIKLSFTLRRRSIRIGRTMAIRIASLEASVHRAVSKRCRVARIVYY